MTNTPLVAAIAGRQIRMLAEATAAISVSNAAAAAIAMHTATRAKASAKAEVTVAALVSGMDNVTRGARVTVGGIKRNIGSAVRAMTIARVTGVTNIAMHAYWYQEVARMR